MNIFYQKSIYFKKDDLRVTGKAATLHQRQIPVDKKVAKIGEEHFRNWNTNNESGNAPSISSRGATRATQVTLTQEVKDIVNEMDQLARDRVYNIQPQRRNLAPGEAMDPNEPINLEDTNPNPNPKFEINFAIPGEARGVGPDDPKYYQFGELGKSVEIEFKDNEEIKKNLQVFYKIDDIADEEKRAKRSLVFTFSLKEHMSNESKKLSDLLEMIRNFSNESIGGGISSHYNANTGNLEIKFSSKRGIKEELDKLRNENSQESKNFFSELMAKFEENEGVQNILQRYDDDVSKEILGQENAKKELISGKFLEYTQAQETEDLVSRIVDSILRKPESIKNKLTRDAVEKDIKKKIKNNFVNEVRLRHEIFKLQTFRNELLKPHTGLDGILEQIFTTNISNNISKQFNSIINALAKAGLKVNAHELMSGIRDGFNKQENRSLSPMVSYAYLKLQEIDRESKREFDSQKRQWENSNPGQQYPHEYKGILQTLKENVISQIDNQINEKAEELQQVKNQQNDITQMETHLRKEFKLDNAQNVNPGRRP